jgi:hypothetical protein
MAFPDVLLSARGVAPARSYWSIFYPIVRERSSYLKGLESGLDRLESVSVRVEDLVKDGAISAVTRVFDVLWRRRFRRSSILDKIFNTNNWHPSDQGRHPDRWKVCRLPAAGFWRKVG